MIDDLFGDWRYEEATLFRTDLRDKDYPPVDVEAAANRACGILDITTEDEDTHVIPLFRADSPTPTNTYVLYKQEHGQVGWFHQRLGGMERFTDCERLETSIIAHRLRFWLPEHEPGESDLIEESDLPSKQVHPIDGLAKDERGQFFADMREFVEAERDAERTSNWEAYTEMGLYRARRTNRVSGPFIHVSRITLETGDTGYQYQLAVDDEEETSDVDLRGDEGLFPGNRCIVDSDASDEHFPIEAELTHVDDSGIYVRPVFHSGDNKAHVRRLLNADSTELWVHELLNPVPFERRLTAIKQVREKETKRKLLTGERPARFAVNRYDIPETEVGLNEYQRLALTWADGARDVVCIHGPPGTGKTRTLTAYVQHAVVRGKSVLISAHSNQAVDNLLVGDSTPDDPEPDTLHALAQDPESQLSIARVGSNTRSRVVQECYIDNSPTRASVVAATTSGASQFDQNEFDVAIVDEATQASRPATAIVLNCAKKLILAGDHKQLPPYCADEGMQDEDMHISLFEHLLDRYGEGISVLLQRQYRMNERIAEFPNQEFYDGRLETDDRNRNWDIQDLKPLMGIDVGGTERRESYGNSFYNDEEAEAVAKQVKLLTMNDVDPSDIGVISAYSGQTRRINNRLGQLEIPNSQQISVDTVDSFQGGEREAIIVSFVRSNQNGNSGFLEFPEEGPRRLNVALTRARKRLVLVGNWETLGTIAPHRSSEDSCAPLYSRLAEHLYDHELMLASSK